MAAVLKAIANCICPESDNRVVCCSAQAELTGLLLYLVWFGHVVLLLPPAPDGTNLLFGVRRFLPSSKVESLFRVPSKYHR